MPCKAVMQPDISNQPVKIQIKKFNFLIDYKKQQEKSIRKFKTNGDLYLSFIHKLIYSIVCIYKLFAHDEWPYHANTIFIFWLIY